MLPKPMQVRIDLRSDTVTQPPAEMRRAIADAELGDDVYGEDPAVNRLEAMSAALLGMEAAVFVPSGTMANLLALLAHCPRGRKVLAGDQSDVLLWEAGGAAVLGGLVYQPVPTRPNGELALADLEAALTDPEDSQCAPAGLICLEDTHCMSGGRALSAGYLESVRAFADRHGLPIHLDGARLFNAAVALGVEASSIARHADSAMFCLSKGLCAPLGSVVAGRRSFAASVRRLRKMLGGGMRQAGIAAAAGVFALERMIDRLAEDHAHARLLAAGLASIPGIVVDPEPPQTNIVIWRLADPRLTAGRFIDALAELQVGVGELGRGRIRAVTHYGIDGADVAAALAAIRLVTSRVAAPAGGGRWHSPDPAAKRSGSILDLMRDAPLVALRGRGGTLPRARLWAKWEGWLPGAMKDRAALAIVERAEAAGALRPGGLIVESSSGTMAEGLARVAAIKGYRVIIVTDPRIDDLTRAKLAALGATLEVVQDYHPNGGWQVSRLARLRQVIADNPGAFWTRQYDNPANGGAYEATLAGELLAALGSTLATLVASVGSGGSLCGTARALRRELPGLRVVAVDAVGSVLFNQPDRQRLQSGHGNSVIPGNLDYAVLDEVHWVADGEAFHACRELARREGIFAGGSSGAAYVVASWAAAQAGPGEDVVALLPDRGDRYFTTVYSDEYHRTHAIAGEPAALEPESIRYGLDVAERWSRAALPHDGSVPYHSPQVRRTAELAAELGLP